MRCWSLAWLLVPAFLQPAISPIQVRVHVPADFPIEVLLERTGLTIPASRTRAEEFTLQITNRSAQAILLVAIKRLAVPLGTPVVHEDEIVSGLKEIYFYNHISHQPPIKPGETRSVRLVVSQNYPGGTEYTVIPYSLLFEDGTSVGKREPFTYKYTQSLHSWIERTSSELRGQTDPRRRALIEELLHKSREILTLIATESQLLENRELLKTAP